MARHNTQHVRVVIVGVGAVTAQGPCARTFWEGVRAGRVAIRPVQRIPMEPYSTRLAGEVQEFVPPRHRYRRPAETQDLVIDFALRAAEEAIETSGIDIAQIPGEAMGVVIGTCHAGLHSGREWYVDELSGVTGAAELLPLIGPQAIAETLSGAFGMRGPTLSISTACAAGANAIGYAADLIRSGQADVMLAGGSDTLSDVLIAGFNALGSLSPTPSAPYTRGRDGLSLGEGSGMLLLVRDDLAQRLGLPLMAEVLGYGLSADGYHPTAPHPEGEGAARAIRAALVVSGIQAAEVDYVNSHGTGTPKNDPAETKATKHGLGEASRTVAVSSTKSMIGHLLGAAGAVEGIATVKALQEQIAPPTANFTEPDSECDLDYVPNVARPRKIEVALSNNLAFGGANACVALARYNGHCAPTPPHDRVVITGIATLGNAGSDPATILASLVAGQRCTTIEHGALIGRIQQEPTAGLTPKERRRMDRLGIFAVSAARAALDDAKFAITDHNRARVGVMFGTGIGPMESMEQFARPLLAEGADAANPAVFPNTVYNAASGYVAMFLKTVGPTSTVTTGHAAGAATICYGYDLVAADRADAMVCVAADTLTPTVIRGYRQLNLVAEDASGTGFALAEAGVALVLERLSSARARGAPIYGEVTGYGMTSDGCGPGRLNVHGTGITRAMRLAMKRAAVAPNDVAAVWGTSAGYRALDIAETRAIRHVFGRSAHVVNPKRVLGEPMGAGGPLNVALALTGWQQRSDAGGRAGPTLVNSSSLGGTHISIVVAPYNET